MLCVSLLVCTFLSQVLQEKNPEPAKVGNAETIRALALGYNENRSKFNHGKIQYRLIQGDFTTEAEIRSPLYIGRYTAKCVYVFLKNDARIEQIFPTESMAAATTALSSTRASSSLLSFRYLTNGKLTFHYLIGYDHASSALSGGTSIVAGPDQFYTFDFPMAIGYPDSVRNDFGSDVRSVITGEAKPTSFSVKENPDVDRVRTVEVTLVMKYGQRTYWLDLDRGVVPTRIHDKMDTGSTTETYFDDIRLVPGHGWLPFTRTVVLGPKLVRKVVIDQVDFDSEPIPEEFRLELAEARSVFNQADGRGYPARKTWDLNRLSTYASKPSPSSGATAPVLAGELEQPPWYPFWIIGIVVGLISMVLAIWYFRKQVARSRI
jgi:hypothetical protein